MDTIASTRLTWEPFNPSLIGYDNLARWLHEFYSIPPYNEYLKCFSCSSPDDFTFKAAYGADESPAGTPARCPDCERVLQPFWSAERAEAFFAGLSRKGELRGITMRSSGQPIGFMWGYEIGLETPAPWDVRPEGKGVYLDRTIVLPEHRGDAWYLFSTFLRELGRDHDFAITRAHQKADVLRLLLKRAKFVELNECPILPQRSYWVRSLAVAGGMPPLLHE